MLRNDALEAHRFLARHFETRARRWPLAATARAVLSADIRERFPTAAIDARDRADRIVEGRFDLLGYRDLMLGAPPDWHADAVHERRTRGGFWASMPYADAAKAIRLVLTNRQLPNARETYDCRAVRQDRQRFGIAGCIPGITKKMSMRFAYRILGSIA